MILRITRTNVTSASWLWLQEIMPVDIRFACLIIWIKNSILGSGVGLLSSSNTARYFSGRRKNTMLK
jgi:hypothetical protein